MNRKLLNISVVFSTLLLLNISCDDNSRSLGTFGINIATVIPESGGSYSLLLDNGKKLWPAASALEYTPTIKERVLLNYTILSEEKDGFDHYIKVNDLWKLLTKNIVELNTYNEDSIGNDPIKTNAIWVGGDYLNVSFHFNYGGERPHFINLVKNKTSREIQNEVIEVELRHNSFESQSEHLYEGFVCFDLKPLRQNDVDSVKLSVKVIEWIEQTDSNKKEIIYDVVYRYNGYKNIQATTEMPIPVITSNEYY
jgi:hypothetical protein